MSDPIEEVNKATLCIHCKHHDICLVESWLDKLLYKINRQFFGFGFTRKFNEVAEVCKQYKRKEQS